MLHAVLREDDGMAFALNLHCGTNVVRSNLGCNYLCGVSNEMFLMPSTNNKSLLYAEKLAGTLSNPIRM
jgi:hypothetical protein